MNHTPLKLRARDRDDLTVMSAVLQDALVTPADMMFDPAAGSFMMTVTRLVRESGDGLRIHCGVRFDDVSRVRRKGFDRNQADRDLVLLAVTPETDDRLTLVFADDAAVALDLKAGIRCIMADLGEPWPTRFTPSHEED